MWFVAVANVTTPEAEIWWFEHSCGLCCDPSSAESMRAIELNNLVVSGLKAVQLLPASDNR